MEEMVQLEQQFRVGELVWAKFSNYPYWPGYIKKILDNNTFEVYYFGDDEKSVEPKDKLKKWREYFDEAIKGNIEDDNYLFSLGVAMMVQERDQRVRNHKQFISNVTPEQKKEIIDEMKEFLLFSKNGNAKNILLRRGKKKPSLTTKDLLKDIKPMKDQIDKSFSELKKLLEKYNNSIKVDTNKMLGRKTSLALTTANMSLRKYNKKYQEIIEPFKGSIFDKLDTEEPSKLIPPLGEYYIYLRKNQNIPIGKKRIYNEKINNESKRVFYRNLLTKFISSIYFYIPNDFIEGLVGYIETYCWNSNNSKLNDDYINIIEEVVNEIMNNNKERNQWNIIKKGRCNGEIVTVYSLI